MDAVRNDFSRIPLSCGRCYVGQTGRCLNDRLREHKFSLTSTVGGHLSAHCKTCTRTPRPSSESYAYIHIAFQMSSEKYPIFVYLLISINSNLPVSCIATPTKKKRASIKHTLYTKMPNKGTKNLYPFIALTLVFKIA